MVIDRRQIQRRQRMAAVWMHDAPLYTNVRLLVLIISREGREGEKERRGD